MFGRSPLVPKLTPTNRALNGASVSLMPFTQDFTTNPNLSNWIIPGTAAASAGGLVITPTLGNELLTNGNLETWSSATQAANWTNSVAGTSTINREGTVVHGGNYAARFDVDASNNTCLFFNTGGTMTLDTWYYITAWMRGSAAGLTANVGGSGSTPSPQFTLTDAYAQYAVSTRARANNNAIIRRVAAPGASIYIDDVIARPITPSTMGIYRRLPIGSAHIVKVLPQSASGGTVFGAWLVVDSPTNPLNGIMVLHDGINQLYFHKVLNGAYSDIIAATTVAYNAASKVEARISGTTVKLYYGNTQKGTDQTVLTDAAITGAYCGVFSASPLNSIKSFELLTN